MQSMWFVAAVALAGCQETPPPCITVDPTCAPQYVPTFPNVYANTISKDCGSTQGACHSASGDSGLSFTTQQTAYDNLLKSYVKPGDPGCSEFVVRTSSPGKDYTMPKGSRLAPPESCA